MPTQPDTTVPHAGFEPQIFWEEHKSKVILYGALLLVALAIYAFYEYSSQQRVAAAGAALASASKPEDYRQIVEKYPRTIAAGNAHLMLANALRDEKKYDESASLLHTFTEKFPQHPLAHAGWLSLAETLEAQGKTDEAMSTYLQVQTKY